MDIQRGAGASLREIALFAGAGGGILAGQLCGDRTVCAVECDAYAAGVLIRQQNAGHLPPFPVWDDVRTFDGRPWRGIADCVSGGFPCQDISAAGTGDGLDGERSGLWREFARVVREVEPAYVRVENSPVLTSRGLGVVLGDLAALGFNARWDVLSAADTGAPHLRERIWIVAAHPLRCGHWRVLQPIEKRGSGAAANAGRNGKAQPLADTDRARQQQSAEAGHEAGLWTGVGGAVADSDDARPQQARRTVDAGRRRADATPSAQDADPGGQGLPAPEQGHLLGAWRRGEGRATAEYSGWPSESGLVRMVHGVANRVDRIKCLGNGQVPRVAAAAWMLLAQELTEWPDE